MASQSKADLDRTAMLVALGLTPAAAASLSTSDLTMLFNAALASNTGVFNPSGLGNSALLPTSAKIESFPRGIINNQAQALLGSTIYGAAVEIPAGLSLTSLTSLSGSTAVVTPSNQWFAILDKTGKVLAVTTDDTTTAWLASVTKTLNIANGPWICPATDMYYLCKSVTGTTQPTGAGYAGLGPGYGLVPFLCVNATLGAATPPAIGSTIVLGFAANKPYIYGS